ncbi:MAG: DUF3078 domain-containing protein [Prevotella sp.]|jgi:hypothetical protein|nr:DUF3078 domain-containing protein [Prevotella sp.]
MKEINVTKISKILLFAVVLSIPSFGIAQRSRNHKSSRREQSFVAAYADSLARFRALQDSANHDFVMVDGAYSRLFVPTTFYNDISRSVFNIGSGYSADSLSLSSRINNALLHVYLHRPDLVRYGESQLNLSDKKLTKEPKAIKVNPDIVEYAAPKAEEPEYIPANIMVERPNFWTFSGDYYLQFLQNYVSSNWYKGGESNYSMVGNITMQYNYNNKQKVKWDNKLEMKLGYQTSRGDTVHRFKASEDLLRYTTKLGLQASKKWYYTIQMIASTQFTHGYKTNDSYVYSDFLSPLTVNLSVGMDYNLEWFKKRLKGTVHFAPLAYNFKYVERRDLAKSFGLDENEHFLHDVGSALSADLSWTFNDYVKWDGRIYAYTTYKRSEMEFENTFTFQLNRYLATKIFIYPRFDDSRERDFHHGYWEFKEYASFGLSYSL